MIWAGRPLEPDAGFATRAGVDGPLLGTDRSTAGSQRAPGARWSRGVISRQADIRCSRRNFVALRDEQRNLECKPLSANQLRILIISLLQKATVSQKKAPAAQPSVGVVPLPGFFRSTAGGEIISIFLPASRIVRWAKAHFRGAGRWPTTTSGPIVEAPARLGPESKAPWSTAAAAYPADRRLPGSSLGAG